MWPCQTGNQALYPDPRPFRKLDEKGSLQWDRITSLEKGKIDQKGITATGEVQRLVSTASTASLGPLRFTPFGSL